MRTTPPPAPVRAASPPPPAPELARPKRQFGPPKGTLAATGVIAAAALAGIGYAASGLWPAPQPRPLDAPVAETLAAECGIYPAICRGTLRIEHLRSRP
jgi:hypothetical protein